jgi:hypothetical protein
MGFVLLEMVVAWEYVMYLFVNQACCYNLWCFPALDLLYLLEKLRELSSLDVVQLKALPSVFKKNVQLLLGSRS